LSPHAQTARLVAPSPRREIARIAVPVSAEFVLTLVLNVVNQIVVGTLGATAIAAVGFANSLTMILVLTLGAIGASVSILVARAHGGGDQTKLNQTVSAALFLAGGVSVLAAVPILVWGESLMRLVGASETVAAAGGGYLSLAGLAVVPTVIGALFSGVLRSTGRPRSPMVATMATVGLNAALAYLFVTGTGPFPELGVPGAGLATLITASLKAGILAVQVFGIHRVVRWQPPTGYASWWRVSRALVVPGREVEAQRPPAARAAVAVARLEQPQPLGLALALERPRSEVAGERTAGHDATLIRGRLLSGYRSARPAGPVGRANREFRRTSGPPQRAVGALVVDGDTQALDAAVLAALDDAPVDRLGRQVARQ